jgi:hypothetical protein
MTENCKFRKSQGYIIGILQHFATKLWNITNFVMLFHAVMKCCLDLLSSKFWLIDLSPYNQNFDLGKSRQIFHHSLKEHDKISNIAKFRCEML